MHVPETIAIAPLSVNHQLDNRSIPMLPYPATEQAFLWSIVITVLYHVLINLFTLAYWIMSTDTVYIKFGGEEPVPDANGERPQLFGRLFGLFDLDRMWHPRIRHARYGRGYACAEFAVNLGTVVLLKLSAHTHTHMLKHPLLAGRAHHLASPRSVSNPRPTLSHRIWHRRR